MRLNFVLESMANGKDKNYISLWFWMFALLVAALPCIGVIMIIVWAFVGENESRKNYFRAIILLFFIFSAIWGGIVALGFWPLIIQQIQHWQHPK
jgi:uncharacterized membrane protein YqjE